MCYYVCISLPEKLSDIAEMFSSEVSLEEASTTPIGRATQGNKSRGVSYVLTEGGCSCSIIGRRHDRTKNVSKHIIDGIEQLLNDLPSVSILVHICHGDWKDEEVCARYKEFISLEDFTSTFPALEEDIRYIISYHRNYSW